MDTNEKLGLRLQRMSLHERDDWRRADSEGFQSAVENRRTAYRAEVVDGKHTNLSGEMMQWLEQNDPHTLTTTRAAITKRDNAKAKADADQSAQDTAIIAENLGGSAWAAHSMDWLRNRAFVVNGETLYPLDLRYWREDFQKIVNEANERKLSLSDGENFTDIVRNLAHAGELHARHLLTGEPLAGYELAHFDLLDDLLRPANQRRDFRTAEEFLKSDPAILAEERRINNELLMRDLDGEFQRLARVEPSFHDTTENRQKLFDYCRANDLSPRQESLAATFRKMWEQGLIGRIPNVDISTGVTNARIHPEPWRDESDEANAFRRAVKKLSSDEYNAALEDPDFRAKADAWL